MYIRNTLFYLEYIISEVYRYLKFAFLITMTNLFQNETTFILVKLDYLKFGIT